MSPLRPRKSFSGNTYMEFFVAVVEGVEGHTVQLLLPAVQAQITLVT